MHLEIQDKYINVKLKSAFKLTLKVQYEYEF